MNNNQTCIHQGVAPINLLECLHFEKIQNNINICPICAYELGFLAGCSKQWINYQEYIKSEMLKIKCNIGAAISLNEVKSIENNKSTFKVTYCIFCAFKQGFEAGNNEPIYDDTLLEKVETPTNINFYLIKNH